MYTNDHEHGVSNETGEHEHHHPNPANQQQQPHYPQQQQPQYPYAQQQPYYPQYSPPQQPNGHLFADARQFGISPGYSATSNVASIAHRIINTTNPITLTTDLRKQMAAPPPVIEKTIDRKKQKLPEYISTLIGNLMGLYSPEQKIIPGFFDKKNKVKNKKQYKKQSANYAAAMIKQASNNHDFTESALKALEAGFNSANENIRQEKDPEDKKFLEAKINAFYQQIKAAIGDADYEIDSLHKEMIKNVEDLLRNRKDLNRSVEAKAGFILHIIAIFSRPISHLWLQFGTKGVFEKQLNQLRNASTDEEKLKALEQTIKRLSDAYGPDHIYINYGLISEFAKGSLSRIKDITHSPATKQEDIQNRYNDLNAFYLLIDSYKTHEFSSKIEKLDNAKIHVFKFNPIADANGKYSSIIDVRLIGPTETPDNSQPGVIYVPANMVSAFKTIFDARGKKDNEENLSKLVRLETVTAKLAGEASKSSNMIAPNTTDLDAKEKDVASYLEQQDRDARNLQATVASYCSDTQTKELDINSFGDSLNAIVSHYKRQIINAKTSLESMRKSFYSNNMVMLTNLISQYDSCCTRNPTTGAYILDNKYIKESGASAVEVMSSINTNANYIFGKNIDEILRDYGTMKFNNRSDENIINHFRDNAEFFTRNDVIVQQIETSLTNNITSLELAITRLDIARKQARERGVHQYANNHYVYRQNRRVAKARPEDLIGGNHTVNVNSESRGGRSSSRHGRPRNRSIPVISNGY